MQRTPNAALSTHAEHATHAAHPARSRPRAARPFHLPLVLALALLIVLPLGVGAQGQGQGAQGSGAQTPGPQGSGAQTPGPQGSGALTPGPQGSGQGNQGNQGQGNNTHTPGHSPTHSAADKGIEKIVFPNTGGTGSKAAEVSSGQSAQYEVRITGAPPGQRGGDLQDDLSDNAPPKMEYRHDERDPVTVDGVAWPRDKVVYDGNKLIVRDIPLADGKTTVVRFKLWVAAGAPCNHVATNVAHVNGIGSDQAQVRIICPTPTSTPATGALAARTNTPTATATTVTERSVEVGKTLEDGGRTITQITPGHFGKRLNYNILLKRKGGVAGRTQMAFDDLIEQGCIADGSGLITPLAAEVDQKDLGIGDDFSIQINGCRITGWVSGDNKGNLDPDAPGNRFHVHITVQVAQPGSAATTTSRPAQVVNKVTAGILGGETGGPCCEQSFTLTTSVTPPSPGGTAAQGPRPASSVNLPTPVEARLVGPVEVGGVTLHPGQRVDVIALPPGAVLQGPNAAVPPGSVLGITDNVGLGPIVVRTPIFVDVLDVGTVRTPGLAPLPQTGTGPAPAPAPALLPQTGAAGASGAGQLTLIAAGLSLLAGALIPLVRRATQRRR